MYRVLVGLIAVATLLPACSDAEGVDTAAPGATGDDTTAVAAGWQPTVVVTTSILGDVVANLVGDQLEVVTIMPGSANPHDFQASAQQANQIREADALIVNGGGFEEGLLDVIESAESDGVPTYAAIDAVDALDYHVASHDDHAHEGEGDHAHEGEGGHAHEGEGGHAHEGEEGHAHEGEGVDPHFFTDALRMADAARGIAAHLERHVEGIDAAALEASTEAYVAELESLHAEVESILAAVDDASRVLVTNHQVFGYFADRYGFEVVGAVIPAGSTTDAASARALAELAETIEREGVPAIFADSSAPDDLVAALAGEVGDVEVVPLFTESLGAAGSGGETYLDMVRTNAQRIAEALG